MICEIKIKNLALIENCTINIPEGFTVFTGETGAGKSIFVNAINLLLGERASSEIIRSGQDETEITGVFDISDMSSLLEKTLNELNLEVEDGLLIIRRIIQKNGRNRIYINQTPVPLSALKKTGNHLVDLHGQHEHQSLLKKGTATTIIDSLPEVAKTRIKYDSSYSKYIKAQKQLDEFKSKIDKLTEKKDFVEFQYKEISAIELKPDEEEKLNNEHKLLSSVTERVNCITSIRDILESEQRGSSLEHSVSKIAKNLESLAKFDKQSLSWLDDLTRFQTYLSELSIFCDTYLSDTGMNGDPFRIDYLNERIAKIQRLKKKHNCSFNDLIALQKELKNNLDSIENFDIEYSSMEKKLSEALNECKSDGILLSNARKKASKSFDANISAIMDRLGFRKGEWKTEFVKLDSPEPYGYEQIYFSVRTNAGEPFTPLIKTASGGEISRLMLAIKSVLAKKDIIPVLIFDEIDNGVGGNTAVEVAKALSGLSESHQVICISHLHQIASRADFHFSVSKSFNGERTTTEIKRLSESGKIDEISRMLGGNKSETLYKHAEELLKKGWDS